MFRCSLVALLAIVVGCALAQVSAQNIHEAAAAGDTAAIRAFVDNDVSLDIPNDAGFTPLHLAIRGRHRDAVELLLASGATIDMVHQATGLKAVDFAFQAEGFRKTAEITSLLVSHGAEFDPDRTVRGPLTRLDLAVSTGNTDMTRLLLALGADPNTRPGHPRPRLVNATASGNIEIVEMLIDAGVPVDQTDPNGNPALLYAIEKGHATAVGTLLVKGATIDFVDPLSGKNLLHYAAIGGHVDIAARLLASGAAVDAVDNDGKTALYYAARYGHRQLADRLIEGGATRPDELNENYGRSPHLTRAMADGEAVAWYLANRGWAIKTSNRVLVFDAEEWGITRPAEPSLANGFITPADLRDLEVIGLYTCYHGEIGEPAYLHEIEDSLAGVTYVQNAGDGWRGSERSVYLSPLQDTTLGGVRIATIPVTVEMTSLGYLVRVDGVAIYYAGFRAEDLDDYTQSLDFFSERVDRVDMAFLPLIETDEDASDYKVFLEKLNPRAVFVLDPDRREGEYARMREKAVAWGFDPLVFTAENPGDAFVFPRR